MAAAAPGGYGWREVDPAMAQNVLFRSLGLFVLSSLLTSVHAQGPTGNQAQPAQVNVGVVDVNKVLANYPKAIDGKKRFDGLGKEIEDRLMAETEQIKSLRLAQESFQRGSRDWQVKELEIAQALSLRDGHKQIWENDYNEQVNRFLVQAYEEVEVAIAQVAKAKNVHIVLRRDTAESQRLDFKTNLYQRRVVWFASDSVDLTAAVIDVLKVPLPSAGGNAGPAGRGAAAPAATGPGKGGSQKE
jgi:Skp family chaperone for outer membrane proteins